MGGLSAITGAVFRRNRKYGAGRQRGDWFQLASILAHDDEVILVGFDIGIPARSTSRYSRKHPHGDRHHLLRNGERYQSLAQVHHESVVFIGQLMPGRVANHFREAAHLSCVITQRRDDTAGPETGAILACLPTLLFTTSCCPRNLQFVPRLTGQDISQVRRRPRNCAR